jgi:hypothetical protein
MPAAHEDWEMGFWSFVRETPAGCWEWTGSLFRNGYGQFGSRSKGCRKGLDVLAHRIAYALVVGQIPAGLQLDHLCRNRACVRPEHLEPVTRRENLLRGVGFAGLNAVKGTCPAGHPLEGENVYMRPDRRGRGCRTCRREQSRRFRERQAA